MLNNQLLLFSNQAQYDGNKMPTSLLHLISHSCLQPGYETTYIVDFLTDIVLWLARGAKLFQSNPIIASYSQKLPCAKEHTCEA